MKLPYEHAICVNMRNECKNEFIFTVAYLFLIVQFANLVFKIGY